MKNSSFLFVPINLQAIVVNGPVSKGVGFNRWSMNYNNFINNHSNPEPTPFTNLESPEQGIYLQWSLPNYLNHGIQNKNLFTITLHINSLVQSLNQKKFSPELCQYFDKGGHPLSIKGKVIDVLKINRQWRICDWSKRKKYLIESVNASLIISDPTINFPLVPNRWLISRIQFNSNRNTLKSWIIQSDYLGNDGTNPFLDPNAKTLKESRLGKVEIFTTDWTEPNPSNLFLKAIGPGNLAFSAYQPGNQNIFSFVDTEPAKDTMNFPDDTHLTYLVNGWYSDSQQDPLNGATIKNWVATLSKVNWKTDQVPSIVPQQSIFHGTLHSVAWQTNQIPLNINSNLSIESYNNHISRNIKVSIGQTAIEGLSELLKSHDLEIDTMLLEAFQYGFLESLDKSDGLAVVNNQIIQTWYGSAKGGIHWKIAPAPMPLNIRPEQDSELESQRNPDPELYAVRLAYLNEQQNKLNTLKIKLTSLQQELHKREYKAEILLTSAYQKNEGLPAFPPKNFNQIKNDLRTRSIDSYSSTDEAIFHKLIVEIQDIQKQIRKFQNPQSSQFLPDPQDPTSINNYATKILKLPNTLILKSSENPRFWHPNDPVIVISGLGPNVSHCNKTSLNCRLSGQTISGLNVNSKIINSTVPSAHVYIPQLPSNTSIPAQIQNLITEVSLIDPNNSSLIAMTFFQNSDEAISIKNAINNKQWSDPQSISPESLSYNLWTPAFTPLFLEWLVDWYPTYVQKNENASWIFDKAQWKFDGEKYLWIGTEKPSDDLRKSFSGRTIVSHHAVSNFEARLQEYLSKNPDIDLKNINTELSSDTILIQHLQNSGIVSQRLSGFYDQLLMNPIIANKPLNSDIASLVEDQHHGIPNPEQGDIDNNLGSVPPYFFPERAGFFMFKKIQIIDRFGQVIDLMYANGNIAGNYQSFKPIRSAYLTPDQPNNLAPYETQYVQQRLCPIYKRKLDFCWVDNKNDQNQIDFKAGSNPVCGWLLPNFLDNSILVYNTEGLLLGEVLAGEGTQGVRWLPAPGSSNPIKKPTQISQHHLRSMIQGLVGKKNHNNFSNFLRTLDETLWFVNPSTKKNKLSLCSLMGRPLALVRAKIQLLWEGEPPFNQSWENTFTRNDGGMSDISFQVSLGSLKLRNDGLIGYYLYNYRSFNTVHAPTDLIAAKPAYIQPIGMNNNYISLKFGDYPLYVTMLIDPQGVIHANTGILPIKSINLPKEFVEEALKSMEITFRVSPLLTDQTKIQMPKLPNLKGDWSWIQKQSPDYHWNHQKINNVDASAHLPDAPSRIVEGWLSLKNTFSS